MVPCPADCSDVTLTPNISNCNLEPRRDGIERIMIFPCDIELPSPLTCAGLQALIDTDDLVFTSPLANVDAQDPEYVELALSDCVPAFEIVSGRVVAFQDKIAIDRPADTVVSPAVAAQPYYNQVFWADKLDNQLSLRYAFIMCSGAVVVAKDAQGNYLPATLRAYLKQENIGTAAAPLLIQYVQGQIAFKGDPLAMANIPELTASNTVFDISACDFY